MPAPGDLPAGRYGAILADPPWAFRTWSGQSAPPPGWTAWGDQVQRFRAQRRDA